MTHDEIKRSLRGLSYEELQEVVTLANTLLAAKPSKDVPIQLQLAYRSFVQPLQVKVGTVPPLTVLKRDALTEVRNALTFLLDWLEKQLQQPVSRTEIQPWFFLFGDLLVQFLEERQVPLSLQALARQHKTVPALLDIAFPGYIRAGLLRWVIVAMKRPRE